MDVAGRRSISPAKGLCVALALGLASSFVSACSATGGGPACSPPFSDGPNRAQGSVDAPFVLGATGSYVVRDATATVVGLCGLEGEQLPDLLPFLIEAGQELTTLGASVNRHSATRTFDLVLIYPTTDTKELHLQDGTSTARIAFPTVPASADCRAVESSSLVRLRCGIGTTYEWSTPQVWSSRDEFMGVGIDVTGAGDHGGVSLAAPAHTEVRDGRLVIDITLFSEGFTEFRKASIQFSLTDVYSKKNGRIVLAQPVLSDVFTIGK